MNEFVFQFKSSFQKVLWLIPSPELKHLNRNLYPHHYFHSIKRLIRMTALCGCAYCVYYICVRVKSSARNELWNGIRLQKIMAQILAWFPFHFLCFEIKMLVEVCNVNILRFHTMWVCLKHQKNDFKLTVEKRRPGKRKNSNNNKYLWLMSVILM